MQHVGGLAQFLTAPSSCPVVIQVSPQQALRSSSLGVQPFAISTAAIAATPSPSKASENESTHSTTSPFAGIAVMRPEAPGATPPRASSARSTAWLDRDANRGMPRWASIPATFLTTADRPGLCMSRFITGGSSRVRDTSRPHLGSQPIV